MTPKQRKSQEKIEKYIMAAEMRMEDKPSNMQFLPTERSSSDSLDNNIAPSIKPTKDIKKLIKY